jgi:hypothetical protein
MKYNHGFKNRIGLSDRLNRGPVLDLVWFSSKARIGLKTRKNWEPVVQLVKIGTKPVQSVFSLEF